MNVKERIALWNLQEDLKDALWLNHWNEEEAWLMLVDIVRRNIKEPKGGQKS
jgi:hypothetical protein